MGSSFNPSDDTIAALATPPGDGGIAVIRLSGPESLDILRSIFKPGGTEESPEFLPRMMYHGYIVDTDNGGRVDEVLAVFMRSPGSYTGQDVVEIHSHGGHIVPKKILDVIFGLGARPANPASSPSGRFLTAKWTWRRRKQWPT